MIFQYNTNIRNIYIYTTSTLIQQSMLLCFLVVVVFGLFPRYQIVRHIIQKMQVKCFKQSANRLLIFTTIVTLPLQRILLHYMYHTTSCPMLNLICLISYYYKNVVLIFIYSYYPHSKIWNVFISQCQYKRSIITQTISYKQLNISQ